MKTSIGKRPGAQTTASGGSVEPLGGGRARLRRALCAHGAGMLAALALAAAALPAVAQTYPSRPVTLIVPWGAGGGTDATARIIGSLLEKEIGQPVTVVNRTGGSGVVGHAAIASAAPDGYTIGMATVEIGMMHWQGLTDLNGASYTPLALVNADPAGVQVRADSPYKTINDLLAPSRPTRASSRPRAPAKGASGTSPLPVCCATRRSIRPPCPGCPATARRPACRT